MNQAGFIAMTEQELLAIEGGIDWGQVAYYAFTGGVAALGAAAGAAIGTAIAPGAGTVAGASLGARIGSVVGTVAGAYVGDLLWNAAH